MIDISDSNVHLPITSCISTPSIPLALLRCIVHCGQALVDPSSITIMIHTTLCAFNEHTLIVIINFFSSFSLDEILLVFMTLKMCSHIFHNVCLDKWIASICSHDIFPVSHLTKLIISFKHQNLQGGLDALSLYYWSLLMQAFVSQALTRMISPLRKENACNTMLKQLVY
jgi:hypothetical protein